MAEGREGVAPPQFQKEQSNNTQALSIGDNAPSQKKFAEVYTLQEGSPSEYPASPEDARAQGYEQQQLLYYGALEHPGVHNVGAKVMARFILSNHSKEERIVTGIVVRSEGASLQILDESTGQVIDVNSNLVKIQEVLLRRPGIQWQNLDVYSVDDNTYDQIQKQQGHYAVVTGSDGGRKFVIAGQVSVVEVSPGYRVMQVVDQDEITHILDFRYLAGSSIAIARSSEDTIEGPTATTEQEALQVFDEDREKRQALVAELARDINEHQLQPFANPKLYEYLTSLTSEQKQRLLRKYYGDLQADEMIRFVENSLGNEYLVLLADPGIAGNFSKFREFLTSSKIIRATDIFSIRKQFSQFLGTTTVYRGMALNQGEVHGIEQRGLVAPVVLNKRNMQIALLDMFDYHDLKSPSTRHPQSIIDGIRERQVDLIGSPEDWILMSVSQYPEVSSSVGWHDSKRTKERGVSPYLFTIEVPTIDLIVPTGIFSEGIRYKDQAVHVGGQIFR